MILEPLPFLTSSITSDSLTYNRLLNATVPAPHASEWPSLYGMKIICDPDLPPNTAEVRAADGRLLKRIIVR